MIAIAADHGGFELKEKIKKYVLDKYKEKVIDCGTLSTERTDYPIYAEILAKKMQNKIVEKGILICKSGHGMNIAANKFKGIYASLCYSKESARKAVEDDNINVCILSSDDVDFEKAKEILDVFLNSTIKEGRYIDRFNMIKNIEENNFKKIIKDNKNNRK